MALWCFWLSAIDIAMMMFTNIRAKLFILLRLQTDTGNCKSVLVIVPTTFFVVKKSVREEKEKRSKKQKIVKERKKAYPDSKQTSRRSLVFVESWPPHRCRSAVDRTSRKGYEGRRRC